MPIDRAFGDPDLTPDNFSSFSKREISADTAAKGLEQLEPFPPARSTTPMELSSVIGAGLEQKIQEAGKITFHTTATPAEFIIRNSSLPWPTQWPTTSRAEPHSGIIWVT